MTRRWWWAVCLGLILVTRGAVKAAPDSTLIQFEMEDQFKQVHRDSSFRGSTLVVLVANKGGSKYSRQWSPALRDSLAAWSWGEEVKLLGVAHMAGVPFFLKGMVKGKLSKEPKNWMLLDWKGTFYKAYACREDTCNVLLFDSAGVLRHRLEVGPLATAPLDSIRSLISAVLKPEAPAAGPEATGPLDLR
jgi:hypothetical protein